MRKVRTILSIVLVVAFWVLEIRGIWAQELPKEDTPGIIEAIEKGYISEIGIEGGENEIKISVRKTNEKGVLNVHFPKGVTKFGFISKDEKIRTAGWRGGVMFSPEEMTVEYYPPVGTDDFNSDGFYVEMDEPLLIAIPEGKRELEASGKGKLKVSVPFDYRGFLLGGVSGTIVSGKIFIEKIHLKRKMNQNLEYIILGI